MLNARQTHHLVDRGQGGGEDLGREGVGEVVCLCLSAKVKGFVLVDIACDGGQS